MVILVLYLGIANAIFFPSCPTYCENRLAGIKLIRPKNCDCAVEHVLHKRKSSDINISQQSLDLQPQLDINEQIYHTQNPVRQHTNKSKIRNRKAVDKGHNRKTIRGNFDHSAKHEQNKSTDLNNIHTGNKPEIEDYSNIQNYLSECIEMHKIKISRLCSDNNEKTPIKMVPISRFEKLSDDELLNEIKKKCEKVKVILVNSVNEIKENSFKRKPKIGEIVDKNEDRDKLKAHDSENNDLKPSSTVKVIRTNYVLGLQIYDDSTFKNKMSDVAEGTENDIYTTPSLKNLQEINNYNTIKAVTNHPEGTENYMSTTPTLKNSQETEKIGFDLSNPNNINNDEEKMKPATDIINTASTNMILVNDKQYQNIYTTECPKNNVSEYNSSNEYLEQTKPREESSTAIIMNIYSPLKVYFDGTTASDDVLHKKNSDDMDDKSNWKSRPLYIESGRSNTNKEEAFPITQLISREFPNGTILSKIDGTEEITNNDFQDKSNNISYSARNANVDVPDDITEITKVENYNSQLLSTSGDRNDSTNTTMYNEKSQSINGRLFFLYDKEKIPARFTQSSNGVLNIGIDGLSMCNVIDKENSSFLLKLLCSCVKSSQNVSETNEKNI